MKKIIFAIAITAAIFAISSCSKEKDADDFEGDLINKILKDTLKIYEEHDGIYLYFDIEGDEEYKLTDSVTMVYSGKTLQNNCEFAKNDTLVFEYGRSGLIPGFQIALPYIKRHSVGELLIPYRFGYGSRKVGNIEAYSTLLFNFKMN